MLHAHPDYRGEVNLLERATYSSSAAISFLGTHQVQTADPAIPQPVSLDSFLTWYAHD